MPPDPQSLNEAKHTEIARVMWSKAISNKVCGPPLIKHPLYTCYILCRSNGAACWPTFHETVLALTFARPAPVERGRLGEAGAPNTDNFLTSRQDAGSGYTLTTRWKTVPSTNSIRREQIAHATNGRSSPPPPPPSDSLASPPPLDSPVPPPHRCMYSSITRIRFFGWLECLLVAVSCPSTRYKSHVFYSSPILSSFVLDLLKILLCPARIVLL